MAEPYVVAPSKSALAVAALVALTAYGALTGVYRSSRRFLWFDELVTMSVAQLGTGSRIWSALEMGADSNPPPFHLVESLAARAASDPHIAYRWPAILGFTAVPVALFLFVARRAGGAAGCWRHSSRS